MGVEQDNKEIESKVYVEDTIKLIINKHTNIPWLLGFVDQLNGMLFDDDIHGTIVRIVHRSDHSIVITLTLQNQNICNLVIKLAFMSSTIEVVEDSPVTFGSPSLLDIDGILKDSSILPSKTLRLVLV